MIRLEDFPNPQRRALEIVRDVAAEKSCRPFLVGGPVRDVLRYLVGCARLPADVHRSFDIGGPDVMTYEQMMQRYAQVAGLPRRRILRVPVLTPSLSSHWVGLVTPVPASIARPLALPDGSRGSFGELPAANQRV